MDIANMGGVEVYAKYLALMKRSYLLTPFSNKHKSALDYYAVDGAANWGHDVFHYCRLDTLKKITKNKQLRFSDIRFLNDTTEFEEAARILRIAVERKKASMDKALYDILTDKKVLSEIKSYSQRYPFYPPINKNRDIDSVKPICKVYTCSFSMDGDLLPMWNYYAQGTDGISINFTDLKGSIESNEKVKIVMGKVWYTEDDKIQCIDALLKDITALFSEISSKKCREEMVQEVLISTINNMRVFMKHEKYKTEEEYRAVLIVPEEVIDNNGLPDGYTQGSKQGNTDKPYIDVPFYLGSITNIIVNPYGDFDSINADMEGWMQKQNLNDIRIWRSNIPMRKY